MAAVALGVLAYGSTNLDNILILASISRAPGALGPLKTGFFLASVAVLLLSMSFIALGLLLPASSLGYLGIIPIALGLKQLITHANEQQASTTALLGAGQVATMLLANSSDTVAAFGPLMAESEPVVVVTLVFSFVVSAAFSLWLVKKLQARVGERAWLDTLAAKGTPFIMIAMGVYILMNTTTDLV